jgi:hypothetical protein
MPADDSARVARHLWTLFEPIHAITYFAPESRTAFEPHGLRGFWRGYFAGRAAPLGRVDAPAVTAAFFSFVPRMVDRAVPDVWDRVTPDDALSIRLAGAATALTRVLPDADREATTDAAALLEGAVDAMDWSGRCLGAANAALDRPASPIERLWLASTALREHRGDGHSATLVAADVSGCEALVWRAGIDLSRSDLQLNRGWDDEEWGAAQARLTERGWLDAAGRVSAEGGAAHDAVEAATDRAAARPWATLGDDRCRRLVALLEPLAAACRAELPFPNPIGVPAAPSKAVR